MNTIGYIFILVAALMIRAVAKGRVTHIGEDLTDAFVAIVSNDAAALREVSSRTGSDTTAPEGVMPATQGSSGESGLNDPSASSATGIAGKAIARGSKAKGYRWGATGPDYYDCSGLMWRSCQDAGAYPKSGSGSGRFTTSTIAGNKAFQRVSKPGIGDIVCWTNHHMGVVTGTDKFYSAKSKKSGIGYGTISTWPHGNPVYYRPKTAPSAGSGVGQGSGGGGGGSW